MVRGAGWGVWAVSVSAHALILTFVWVGFSVSMPQGAVGFYYTGSSLPPQGVRPVAAVDRVVEGASADPYPAAYFPSWINMRDVDKPRR